jgi:hypothetical protein
MGASAVRLNNQPFPTVGAGLVPARLQSEHLRHGKDAGRDKPCPYTSTRLRNGPLRAPGFGMLDLPLQRSH